MWKGEGRRSEKVKQEREQDLEGRAQGAGETGCCVGVCGTATQPWDQVVVQKGEDGWRGRGEQKSSSRDEQGLGCGYEALESDQAIKPG